MRKPSPLFRAIASGFAVLLLALPSVAADFKGIVRSVDPARQRITVGVQPASGPEREVAVEVTPRTAIVTGAGSRLEFGKIAVGMPVAVHEDVLAAQIVVAEKVEGILSAVRPDASKVVISPPGSENPTELTVAVDAHLESIQGESVGLATLEPGSQVVAVFNRGVASEITVVQDPERPMLAEFWHNLRHNLFKPLLLFFYIGFLIPLFKVKFDFPYVIYQGLTIYLLIAIGWHGGEELASLKSSALGRVIGFMGVGFVVNFCIGCLAYGILRAATRLRRIDAATVAGYYGSDSAGTFVTCLGVLATARIAHDAFMPVMLAVMEIPGCLVALYLVSLLRKRGMDPAGTMPDEPGYNPEAKRIEAHSPQYLHQKAVEKETEMALERVNGDADEEGAEEFGSEKPKGVLSAELLHEVFLNPGIFLLFGGILVGFISRSQGPQVTKPEDPLFIELFQGLLCLFLLEMGMTASRRLRDLGSAGWRFVLFGMLAPPLFATMGILVAHAFGWLTHHQFQLGTYVLFSVLCGAASYIAVPAVQRLAIPEASPTLPLAASLGLTFSFNVTLGIPIYIGIARFVIKSLPLM